MSNAGEVGHFNLACNEMCPEANDWAGLDADMATYCQRNKAVNHRLETTKEEMRNVRNVGEFEKASEEDRRMLKDLEDFATKRSAATKAFLLSAERVWDAALATPCDPFYRTIGACTRIARVSQTLAMLAGEARDDI